jgi:hypothetical protein
MKNRPRNERRRARREAVSAVVFTACIILCCGLPNWLEVWLCAI